VLTLLGAKAQRQCRAYRAFQLSRERADYRPSETLADDTTNIVYTTGQSFESSLFSCGPIEKSPTVLDRADEVIE
jgi:hypothetical protein